MKRSPQKTRHLTEGGARAGYDVIAARRDEREIVKITQNIKNIFKTTYQTKIKGKTVTGADTQQSNSLCHVRVKYIRYLFKNMKAPNTMII